VEEVLRRIDEATDVWGATLLRLNLESYAAANGRLQSLGVTEDQAYLRDLTRVARHVGAKRGVYLMISPWRDPTLSAEGWPTAQTRAALAALARALHDASFVIFAVSSEPRQNLDGAQDAAAWQAMNDAVEAIRAEERARGARRHLVAVQGTRDLGRDLSYYLTRPIAAEGGANVLYETHIFNPRADLSRLLTTPAQSLPTVVGAFGPAATPQRSMSLEDAQALMAEAERQGASWAAWTFHMRCQTSALLVDASAFGCGVGMPLQPTEWGQAVLSQLQSAR
jgi:endoglucanase